MKVGLNGKVPPSIPITLYYQVRVQPRSFIFVQKACDSIYSAVLIQPGSYILFALFTDSKQHLSYVYPPPQPLLSEINWYLQSFEELKNEEALLKNSRHLRAKFWYSEDDFFGQYINNCLGFPAGWSSLVFLSSSPWWSQSYIYHQNFDAYNYNRLLNAYVVFYLFLHEICGVYYCPC